MSSSEKTLDKLLSLISTGGSQKALMSLSVLSQFCSPVAVETIQEDVAATLKSQELEILPTVLLEEGYLHELADPDPEFNFSVCSASDKKDAETQCDATSTLDKDRLMLELQMLEVERKKLELQNLLQQNKLVERQQQSTLKTIQKVQLQVEESVKELNLRQQKVEKLEEQISRFQEERSQFEVVREQAEYDRECLQRERSLFEVEKQQWQRKIDQFAEDAQRDSEEVNQIRNEIERYHKDQRALVERELQLEQHLEQFKESQLEFEVARECLRSDREKLEEEKLELLHLKEDLNHQKQDLQLSRLELKAQTENFNQTVKSFELTMRIERENIKTQPDSSTVSVCTNIQQHRRRSDALQNVLAVSAKLRKFEQGWHLRLKRQVIALLKKELMAEKVLTRLAAIFWGRLWIAIDAIKSAANASAKENLIRNRSPQVKKSLVLKRSTRVDSKQQLPMETQRSENYESEYNTYREPATSKPVIQLHRKKMPLEDQTLYYDSQQNAFEAMTIRSFRVSSSNMAHQKSHDQLDVAFRRTDVASPQNEAPWMTARDTTENTPFNKPTRPLRSESHNTIVMTRERSNTTTQKKLKIARSPHA